MPAQVQDRHEAHIHKEFVAFSPEHGMCIRLVSGFVNDEPAYHALVKITGTRLPPGERGYNLDVTPSENILSPTLDNYSLLTKRFAKLVQPHLSVE